MLMQLQALLQLIAVTAAAEEHLVMMHSGCRLKWLNVQQIMLMVVARPLSAAFLWLHALRPCAAAWRKA
jgi:hypothetical protein